ncbi:MAG: molybdopterin-binding protein, partial [Sandaracinobacteroides sp.]
MIFGALPLPEAAGAMLAHAITIEGRRYAKGHVVDAALLAAAKAARLTLLWVARMEPGDVPEAQAATLLGARLAGPGLEARPPVHGRVNLHATGGGLVAYAPSGVTAANLASEAVGISTLPPFTTVAEGDLVATIKIIPYALSAAEFAAAAQPLGPIAVERWRAGLFAQLVQTLLPETSAKL